MINQKHLSKEIATKSSIMVSLRKSTKSNFGHAKVVFSADEISPCSILIEEKDDLNNHISLQIKKEETNEWFDYEEGQMILSKKVKCRIFGNPNKSIVRVRVLHNN